MIDTIVLTLRETMFNILDHQRFSPSTEGLFDPKGYYRLGGRSNIVCRQNPTKSELRSSIYKPRLSVTKRLNKFNHFETMMKVEFSAPKLLRGNNFDELEDSDFPEVADILQNKLKDMGVRIFHTLLVQAPISGIHYSKNIALTDYSTPYMYLEKLSKANMNQRLDLNQTDFKNGGHGLKFHANSFEIAFYNKLKDLQQAKISEKRAYEIDNAIQLSLFDDFKEIQKRQPFEVLRMEARLNKRAKIRQMLKKIGHDVEPTFQNLFRKDISQKILLNYIDEIEAGYSPLLSYQDKQPKKFLIDFAVNNPRIGLGKMMQMLGLRVTLDDVGMREFREIISRYGPANWYKLNKEMKSLCYPPSLDAFGILRSALNEFVPLKLPACHVKNC